MDPMEAEEEPSRSMWRRGERKARRGAVAVGIPRVEFEGEADVDA
jgi:hypothetical protein